MRVHVSDAVTCPQVRAWACESDLENPAFPGCVLEVGKEFETMPGAPDNVWVAVTRPRRFLGTRIAVGTQPVWDKTHDDPDAYQRALRIAAAKSGLGDALFTEVTGLQPTSTSPLPGPELPQPVSEELLDELPADLRAQVVGLVARADEVLTMLPSDNSPVGHIRELTNIRDEHIVSAIQAFLEVPEQFRESPVAPGEKTPPQLLSEALAVLRGAVDEIEDVLSQASRSNLLAGHKFLMGKYGPQDLDLPHKK